MLSQEIAHSGSCLIILIIAVQRSFHSLQVPKSHWKSIENRKKFLDEVAIKLDVKTPSDWGKVTKQRFCEVGGSRILSYYNNSLFYCLHTVYKGNPNSPVPYRRYQMETRMVHPTSSNVLEINGK